MYFSRVGKTLKMDKQVRPNAKNMCMDCMNLGKKRWLQYSTHVKSYEQKCVQPCVLRHSPLSRKQHPNLRTTYEAVREFDFAPYFLKKNKTKLVRVRR